MVCVLNNNINKNGFTQPKQIWEFKMTTSALCSICTAYALMCSSRVHAVGISRVWLTVVFGMLS